LNKSQLIDEVAKETGLTKSQATRSVQAVFDAIEASLKRGDPVGLLGFGTFSVAARPARTGRNPRTGAEIAIPETRLPKFKPGKLLKDAVMENLTAAAAAPETAPPTGSA
jgi:DNA-binding protein HU-beta